MITYLAVSNAWYARLGMQKDTQKSGLWVSVALCFFTDVAVQRYLYI